MYQTLAIICAIFLLGCSNSKSQKKLSIKEYPDKPSEIISQFLPNIVVKDTLFWYKEVPNDFSIKSDFRIIIDDYKFYFDKKVISSYCDSIIKLNDERKKQFINIRQEVNHQTHVLYINNAFIILTTFRPNILNMKTKKPEKSLFIQYYKDQCNDVRANLFIVTENGERVKLSRLDIARCII